MNKNPSLEIKLVPKFFPLYDTHGIRYVIKSTPSGVDQVDQIKTLQFTSLYKEKRDQILKLYNHLVWML